MSWSRKISNVNRRRALNSRRWRLMNLTLRTVIGCLGVLRIFLFPIVKILLPIVKNYLRISKFFRNFASNFKNVFPHYIVQIIRSKFTNVNCLT